MIIRTIIAVIIPLGVFRPETTLPVSAANPVGAAGAVGVTAGVGVGTVGAVGVSSPVGAGVVYVHVLLSSGFVVGPLELGTRLHVLVCIP